MNMKPVAKKDLLKVKPTRLPRTEVNRVSDLMEGEEQDPLASLADDVLEGRAERNAAVGSSVRSEVVIKEPQVNLKRSSIDELVEGSTYDLPLNILRETPLNARHHYFVTEVDHLAQKIMSEGQLVAATGYVDDGVVKVLDGGKRLRALRVANMDTMRVYIIKKPENARQAYLTSRSHNETRSTQTCFDDAFRFKQLLDEKVYGTQSELAKDVYGDEKKQWKVSRILSLNKLPQDLIKVMREGEEKDGEPLPRTANVSYAELIAECFSEGEDDDEEKIAKIIDVVHLVKAKGLSVKEMKSLLQSRLSGPKQRDKSESMPVSYGDMTGKIKAYKARGQVDFSIKGIPEGEVDKLIEVLKKAISEARAGDGNSGTNSQDDVRDGAQGA